MKNKQVDKKASLVTSESIEAKLSIDSRVIVVDTAATKRSRKKPNINHVKNILSRVVSSINDNRAMLELLPDLKLVKRIIVPSILSPKDLSSFSLHIRVDDSVYDEEIDADLMADITSHFKTKYNFEEKMTKILDEALFDCGSYSTMVLPEASLANLVTANKQAVGMESAEVFIGKNTSLFTSLNILGKPKADSVLKNMKIDVFDNPSVLYANSFITSKRSEGIGSALGMEAFKVEPELALGIGHGAGTDSGTNPLVMKIPADAIIPVHTPSDPTDHVGYYILLDANGVPVTKIRSTGTMDQLRMQITQTASGTAMAGLIKSSGFNIAGGADKFKDDPNLFITKFIETVENELHGQLKDGAYGDTIEVSRPKDVYHLMLSRLLSQKKTKLLYVPKEIITYFAFDHDDYGIGKSLLEDTKVFGSLRAILMFAEVMAGVKSAVGKTQLDITLDEDDHDPEGTIEAVLHRFADMQTNRLPVGLYSPGDIITALQKAAIEVNVEGGDAFPGTKSETTDSSRDYRLPDSDLLEKLKRMHYSGLGISPEIIDNAMNGELATVVVSRDQLFAKSVCEWSSQFERDGSDHIQKYTRCSGELINRIKAGGVKDENIPKFISALRMELPRPDMAGVQSQAEAYAEYSEAVEAVVEAYVTEDMMAEFLDGDLDSGMLESLRISIGNLIRREWLSQQGIFPEIASRIADGEISDKIVEYNKTTVKNLEIILKGMAKNEIKAADKIEKLKDKVREKLDMEEPEPEEEEVVSGGDTPTEEPSGDDVTPTEPEGDDANNLDDFGGDLKF